MRDDDAPLIRVGDLADRAGLTVRALHHYEDIGLLRPSTRSAAGHRLYGPDAVDRLYRVNRLRRVGLSLDQVGRILDGEDGGLSDALERHRADIDDRIARLTSLRSAVHAALTDVDTDDDPTERLLEVLSAMETTDNGLRRRISILVYRDLPAVHAHLVDVFGFTPGEVTLDDDGTAVHAEVYVGDGTVWLHPETETYRLASPTTLGSATATMAVMVDDVDAHHRVVEAKGGDVVYPPTDQPYGYREYGVRDIEGTLWSFMKELDG